MNIKFKIIKLQGKTSATKKDPFRKQFHSFSDKKLPPACEPRARDKPVVKNFLPKKNEPAIISDDFALLRHQFGTITLNRRKKVTSRLLN